MRLSPTVGLVMTLAARETIAGELPEIGVEHLFLAILKVSELDAANVKEFIPNPRELEQIERELAEVRAILKGKNLHATSLRRKLRKVLGKGGARYDGKALHRSSAAHQVFSEAEDLCRKSGNEVVSAAHLLRAILQNTTVPLANLLKGQAPVALQPKASEPKPISAAVHFQMRNLSELAAQGKVRPIESRQIQASALIRHARHALKRTVLLVSENETSVRECVDSMVCGLVLPVKAEAGEEKEPLVVVEATLPARTADSFRLSVDDVRRIVRETSEAGASVLVLMGGMLERLDLPLDLLASALRDEFSALERPLCVMISASIRHIRQETGGSGGALRACHVVWLHSEIETDVPVDLPFPPLPGMEIGERPAFFNRRSLSILTHLHTARQKGFGDGKLSNSSFLAAAANMGELASSLGHFLGMAGKTLRDALSRVAPGQPPVTMPGMPHTRVLLAGMPLDAAAGLLLASARELARKIPDNSEPGLVDVLHVAGAMALSTEVAQILKVPPAAAEDVLELIEELFARDLSAVTIGELTHTLKDLRTQLLGTIFGQDHAIHAFVEGLFNAEVVGSADRERRRPKAVFLFAGPPGVGKTFLAESGARALGRPFKRFDMSSYSDSQVSVQLLSGMQRSYQGAHAGQLTDFVENHPNCILLFDEIEKAHLNVIQLFLQLLDFGSLQDRFTERNVAFKDAIIIFTTNAGKKLYDDPNSSSVCSASSKFHRKTILNALENEIDPRTGKHVFPQAIVSRLATGYPLMFNRLGVNELERIAESELRRMADLFEEHYLKEIYFGPEIPMCIVLREGANSDARTVRSQAEAFVKAEIFQLSKLFEPSRFDSTLAEAARISFVLDPLDSIPDQVRKIFHPDRRPRILLIAGESLGELWARHVEGIEWSIASDDVDALSRLAAGEFDLVLLDLWLAQTGSEAAQAAGGATLLHFDYTPAAASRIRVGQELLRSIHERHPDIPCFLISLKMTSELSKDGREDRKIDDELLLACLGSGGARGLIETSFTSCGVKGWEEARDELDSTLQDTARRVYREHMARELGAQRKALTFESAPKISPADHSILMRLRNLGLTSAVEAEDVAAVLQDVERPAIRFDDVYGAASAKEELDYIVRWLKDPRRFQLMGLRPPRGILLHGSPGTGKTMLARALAGECDVTFIVESATNFVMKWVGTGPENVRNLFARARRYAPTILFIDEIDAVGRKRSGGGGPGAQAYEGTLNAILTEMDGFRTPSQKPVIVVAATNLPESLDEALRRRFDREIEVDKPDRAARRAYLGKRLQGGGNRRVSDESIERLAGQSANMTIAELERVVELAGRMAANKDGVISDSLVEEAFERMRMGDPKGKTDPETLLRVARHEAGHCLIGWLCGVKPVQLTIVARGKAGGFFEREAEEERMLFTSSELEGMIRQAMGGRAAEIVCYGEESGLSSGAADDLRRATHYAELMVRDFGMDAAVGQIAIDPGRLSDGPLTIRVMEAAERIVRSQLTSAIEHLNRHRTTLDELVEALMKRNRLTRPELEAILQNQCLDR